MTTKIIVTNLQALRAKYADDASFDLVKKAVTGLIQQDANRGIQTTLIALDDRKVLGAAAIQNKDDPAQTKRAIDKAYHVIGGAPDYMTILGATDVVTHQQLINPHPDEEHTVPSDLPYACEAPYAETVEHFVGPTRVVGRIPDVTGAATPVAAAAFVRVIEQQAKWERGTEADYAPYFAVAVPAWKDSATASVDAIFHKADELQLSPPEGPDWPLQLLRRKSHFIQCHGAYEFPKFFDLDQGGRWSPVLDAKYIDGELSPGTVAVAECCYSADLYDPAASPAGGPGICNVYLANGSYGYVGSTSISYDIEALNGDAESLCQLFFEQVMAGASLGRAFLEARQHFGRGGVLESIHQKTLAQFILLGDASIHPLASAALNKKLKWLKLVRSDEKSVDADQRRTRRLRLIKQGETLQSTSLVATRTSSTSIPEEIRGRLLGLAAQERLVDLQIVGFAVKPVPGRQRRRKRSETGAEVDMIYELSGRDSVFGRRTTVFAASVREGRIVDVRKYRRS